MATPMPSSGTAFVLAPAEGVGAVAAVSPAGEVTDSDSEAEAEAEAEAAAGAGVCSAGADDDDEMGAEAEAGAGDPASCVPGAAGAAAFAPGVGCWGDMR
ncbi:hypothetical protein ACFYSH_17870 [Streptomyces sp. NPDC005791]|uniref:hypothetical protein n=1 Tax=Streptomyces sp. NPDC005791 TaxID=3364732 RepID=UPI0036A76303